MRISGLQEPRGLKRDVLAVAVGARDPVDGNLVLCPWLAFIYFIVFALRDDLVARRKSVLTSQPASGAHSAAP